MTFRHGLLAVMLVLCAAQRAAAAIESASVTGGAIEGQVVDGIGVFKGIPFAAPPVGELRWQVPKPVVPWEGVRKAHDFAPACIQPWNPAEHPQPKEDCLYLNVWTGAASSSDPRYILFYPTLKSYEEKGEALFRELGVADLQAARALPPTAILKATEGWPPKFGMIRDGDLVQGANHELFQQRRFNDVPTLIGYTLDEAGEPPPEVTRAAVEADMAKLPCKHTHDALTAAYGPLVNDEQARAIVRQAQRDENVGWPMWTWARLQTAHGESPVYVYFFDIHSADKPHGAPHATEYPYIFGTLPSTRTERDVAASAMIRRYLINFAANGDPNGPGLPKWEKFNEATQRVMVFDERPSAREWPNLAALQAFTPFLRCFGNLPIRTENPR